MGALWEGLCTCVIISYSVPLRMRNVPDKVVEKFKTHTSCSITFFLKIVPLKDDMEKYGRPR